MLNHPQREQIRKQADSFLRLYGGDMRARERSILALMDEYGISDKSACQYFTEAKKRFSRLRRPHGATV